MYWVVCCQYSDDVCSSPAGDYSSAWLSGRGNGSEVVVTQWHRAGALPTNTSLWRSGEPGTQVTTEHCLVLKAYEVALRQGPRQPYNSAPCSLTYYALCEGWFTLYIAHTIKNNISLSVSQHKDFTIKLFLYNYIVWKYEPKMGRVMNNTNCYFL